MTLQICEKYGYKHDPRKWPAFGKVCKNWNKRNHFAKKCKSKKMHEVYDNDSDSHIFLNSVETKDQLNDWKVNVKIQNKNISVKHDTGAQCNVLPLQVYRQINRNKPLKRSNSRLVSYSGHRLDTAGKVTLLYQLKTNMFQWNMNLSRTKQRRFFGLKLVWNSI